MSLYTVSAVDVSLTSGTQRTMLQVVTPSTVRARIREWSVSFDGTTPTDAPATVWEMRQTTAGTSSAFTPVHVSPDDPSAQSSALIGFSGTEPSYGDLIKPVKLTPCGGLLIVQEDREMCTRLAVSTRWALVVTPAAAVHCTAYVVFEE